MFIHGSVATKDAWMYFVSLDNLGRKEENISLCEVPRRYREYQKNVEQRGWFSKDYFDIYATFCSSILSAHVNFLMMTQCETQRQFLEL